MPSHILSHSFQSVTMAGELSWYIWLALDQSVISSRSLWSLWKSKRASKKKKSTSALLTTPKSLTVWITTNSGEIFKRWEYQTTLPASWEICMQVKKQQLELDIEQQTGSKLEKEYIKVVYCHPAYLTYMQIMLCKMLDWAKHKLQSRLPGEITITSDMQITPHLWQKAQKN